MTEHIQQYLEHQARLSRDQCQHRGEIFAYLTVGKYLRSRSPQFW